MAPLLNLLLGLIPSFAWLVFYLHEDAKKPEPKILIFYTFLLGTASAILVLPFQMLANNWLKLFEVPVYSAIGLIVLAATEELVKFLAVFWGISKRKEFDEPIDAMIYMITAALGFAAVENVASALQSVSSFETASLRFVGATLLHSLTSGLVGYYWARGSILKGLAVATVLHAVFNYLIINTGPVGPVIIFLVFVAYFLLNDFEEIKHAPDIKANEQ